jgi:hypothetical protein
MKLNLRLTARKNYPELPLDLCGGINSGIPAKISSV